MSNSENSKKLYIPVILGTNRQGRQSKLVADFVLQEVNKRDDMEGSLVDVRDFALPHDNYGPEIKNMFEEWRNTALKADGFIIIAPEYNHSFPGVLKSVLDLLLKEYIHKAVGLVGVSAGMWGGVRVIQSLLPVMRELGLVTTFTDLNFPKVSEKFDENGVIKDDKYIEITKKFLDELSWMAKVLRWGRENIPSEYHN